MYNYPNINQLKENSLLYDKNVYFIQPYDQGVSLDVKITSDVNMSVNIQPLNWDGTPKVIIDDFLTKSLELNEPIINNFRLSGIFNYQLFFDSQLKIVDLVVNNEFVSTGMLINLLGNSLKLQKILAHGVLNKQSLDKMINDHQKFIIKPSIRFCIDDDKSRPYYARIL